MRTTLPSKEFTVVRDLYKESEKGSKVVKKNVQSKIRIYLEDIYVTEEVIGNSGKVIKGQCGLNIRDRGFVVVKGKFEVVTRDIFGDYDKESKKVGFE